MALCIALSAFLLSCPQAGVGHELLPPPPLADGVPVGAPEGAARQRAGRFSVDPMNRAEVVALYNQVYTPIPDAQWSGSVGTCTAGSTAAAYTQATLDRINYYRALTGLPSDITFNATWNIDCQAAALIMIAQGALSHTPPSNWACWTQAGYNAAGVSNIYLGRHGPPAVDGYIQDNGSGNEPVGHRRWLLYPPQQTMASGSTTAVNGLYFGSNALRVIGGWGTRPVDPEWVAWPPRGYVPYNQAYARWSFSIFQGDFTSASVVMTHQGNPLALTVIVKSSPGYGDPTLVWVPDGISLTAPLEDETYTVQISGVLVNGVARNFTYDVILMDPAWIPPTSTPTPSNTPSLTSSPTLTPTVTRTPTATPSFTPSVPVIEVGSSAIRPSGRACVPVSLFTAGMEIAASANTLALDDHFTLGACTINPDLAPGKTLAVSTDGDDTRVSIDGDPIPMPNIRLYSCEITAAADTPSGAWSIDNLLPIAETPAGGQIPATAIAGELKVTTCAGDCDGNGSVTLDEVQRCLAIFLGHPLCDPSGIHISCPIADINGDNHVSLGEAARCAASFLASCP